MRDHWYLLFSLNACANLILKMINMNIIKSMTWIDCKLTVECCWFFFVTPFTLHDFNLNFNFIYQVDDLLLNINKLHDVCLRFKLIFSCNLLSLLWFEISNIFLFYFKRSCKQYSNAWTACIFGTFITPANERRWLRNDCKFVFKWKTPGLGNMCCASWRMVERIICHFSRAIHRYAEWKLFDLVC